MSKFHSQVLFVRSDYVPILTGALKNLVNTNVVKKRIQSWFYNKLCLLLTDVVDEFSINCYKSSAREENRDIGATLADNLGNSQKRLELYSGKINISENIHLFEALIERKWSTLPALFIQISEEFS